MPAPVAWRTVRVFISSTFLDMQAERDHLVRFVFPRLREELLKRRIHFLDVDLRWGVTSEQDALAVCREIIDECRPRFLCMLGGRYGWTPQGRDRSITADEVHYAALGGGREAHRFFYFRDPAATAAMVEERPGQYREPVGSPNEGRLARLKSSITDAGYEPFVYPAQWDGSQKRLVGLEAFGQRVYDDLLASINDEFGTEPPAPLDEFAEEAAAMEAFIEERTARYVVGSRQVLLDEMAAFVVADGSPNILLLTGSPGSGKSALLAHFSSIFSRITNHASRITSHFVGASPGSTDLRRTLRRLCHELQAITGATDAIPLGVDELIPRFSALLEQAATSHRIVLILDALNQMDPSDGAHTLRWLPRTLPPNVRIIISSLEHDVRSSAFRRSGSSEDRLKAELQTGPPTAPEQHPVLQALRFRREQVREERLGPLTAQDSEAIATAFARRYRKTLDRAQLDALLSKAESASPLYLLVALEQLRTLGTYEEITERIRQLPGDVRGLFLWILRDRLSNDPGFHDAEGNLVGAELVRRFVSYLGVSRHGLSHAELVGTIAPGGPPHVTPTLTLPSPTEGEGSDHSPPSLGGGRGRVKASPDGGEPPRSVTPAPQPSGAAPDPQGNVAALERLVRPYLLRRGELLDFAHTQLREAVEADYLAAEPKRLAAHTALATYFASVAHIQPIVATSVPLVETGAGDAEPTSGTLVATPPAAIAGPGTARYCNPRTLSEMPYHQTGARLWDALESTLTDIFFLEGKAVAGMVFDLALDFSAAVAGLPDDRPQRRILRLLEEALGRDIHFIARHAQDYPQALLQCLWNSCWWYDCPEAARHYVEPKGGWYAPPPWLRPGPRLSELLAGWRRAAERATRGRPWLRSLRPSWGHLAAGELRVLRGHEGAVTSVAFSPDGLRLASGADDRTVRVWEAETGERVQVLRPTGLWANSLSFSPDGRRLASGSEDHAVRVWDTERGEELQVLRGHEDYVNCVCFAPDGLRLASGSSDHTARVWDTETGKELRVLRGHERLVTSVSFSADGCRLASGSYDCTLRVWDAATGQQLRVLRGHKGEVRTVSFSPDGRRLASGSGDSTVRVWDAATGEELRVLKGHERDVESVSFSPDGCRLASGSWDDTVRVWDPATGDELRVLRGHERAVNIVSFSPDGRRLASGSEDRTVRVWDPATGEEPRVLRGHEGSVTCVSFSPEGRQLASGSMDPVSCRDNTIRLWDAATGEEVRVLRRHRSWVNTVSFSADGRLLASGSGNPLLDRDNTVRVWDAATGDELQVLRGHQREVSFVSFSPDGQRLASGSGDCTVRVWDATTGEELRVLRGHERGVNFASFSPDGRRLQSGSEDHTVGLWDLESGECIDLRACRVNMVGLADAARAFQFPLWADMRGLDMVIEDAATREAVAWFPATLDHTSTHPSGRAWAGSVVNYVAIITLEGETSQE